MSPAHRRTAVAGRTDGPPLEDLSPAQCETLFEMGTAADLKLHKFKRTMGLARVQRVIGTLRAIGPMELLDIGSGRGAALWPILDAFPQLSVTAIDAHEIRARDLDCVSAGGITQLTAVQSDVTALPFDGGQFDIATALEVLEHIPNVEQAVGELARVTRRFLIFSVPSKEDDNPEHLRVFNEETLADLVAVHNIARPQLTYVPGHIVGVVNLVR